MRLQISFHLRLNYSLIFIFFPFLSLQSFQFFVRINLIVLWFCLSIIFWIKVNITLKVSEQHTNYAYYYVCSNLYLFHYFLSVWCNVMLATIKKKKRWKLNYILPLNKTKLGVRQIDQMKIFLIFWSNLCKSHGDNHLCDI